MGKQRAYVTGHKARAAIQESMRLLDKGEEDVVAFAIAGAKNDHKLLESIGRGLIRKMEQSKALQRAALSGRFEGVEKAPKDAE